MPPAAVVNIFFRVALAPIITIIIVVVGRRFSLVGLSRVVEALGGETASPSAGVAVAATAKGGEAAAGKAAAAKASSLASHHREQDLGVDAATHAAHTAAKHV
jgi:hypothetical protein